MGERTSEFVARWAADNTQAEPCAADAGDDSRPAQHAAACTAAAEWKGNSRTEIEGAVGDLEEHMHEAVEEVADAEVGRPAAKTTGAQGTGGREAPGGRDRRRRARGADRHGRGSDGAASANPAAELGREGGAARARKPTPEQRERIARKGAASPRRKAG